LVNEKPLATSLSERLFNRLVAEFPEFADEMRSSDIRPSRLRDRCTWTWSYWPAAHISIGSAWTMAECVKDKKWEIFQAKNCYDIEIFLPETIKRNQQPTEQEQNHDK
jgi:hypothetical protein